MLERSPLHTARYAYTPKVPEIFLEPLPHIKALPSEVIEPDKDKELLKSIFPNSFGKPAVKFVKGEGAPSEKAFTVGVILSGGPAAGGHNVIAGLFDGIKKANPKSKLIGFKGGPSGLIDGKYLDATAARKIFRKCDKTWP